MHGSPLSKWDNRLLWTKYDYKNYGILAEPYLDLDFNKIFYLTDAGRYWGSDNLKFRDKVQSTYVYNISDTQDIINYLESRELPNQIMLNIHPEHWSGSLVEWLLIKLVRLIRNSLKRLFYYYREMK